jgi:CheY-like chemotaxis protein
VLDAERSLLAIASTATVKPDLPGFRVDRAQRRLMNPEILLVEDNADDRALFARAVAASGLAVHVTYASRAPEAVMRLNRLGIFEGTPLPALIILDLGLPGLQGQILLQVIRNAYGPRAVPVIVLTGSLREQDKADCEHWGISDYVVKPGSLYGLTQFVAGLSRFFAADSVTGRIPAIQKRDPRRDG